MYGVFDYKTKCSERNTHTPKETWPVCRLSRFPPCRQQCGALCQKTLILQSHDWKGQNNNKQHFFMRSQRPNMCPVHIFLFQFADVVKYLYQLSQLKLCYNKHLVFPGPDHHWSPQNLATPPLLSRSAVIFPPCQVRAEFNVNEEHLLASVGWTLHTFQRKDRQKRQLC